MNGNMQRGFFSLAQAAGDRLSGRSLRKPPLSAAEVRVVPAKAQGPRLGCARATGAWTPPNKFEGVTPEGNALGAPRTVSRDCMRNSACPRRSLGSQSGRRKQRSCTVPGCPRRRISPRHSPHVQEHMRHRGPAWRGLPDGGNSASALFRIARGGAYPPRKHRMCRSTCATTRLPVDGLSFLLCVLTLLAIVCGGASAEVAVEDAWDDAGRLTLKGGDWQLALAKSEGRAGAVAGRSNAARNAAQRSRRESYKHPDLFDHPRRGGRACGDSSGVRGG